MRKIYLDHAATTPLSENALNKMLPFMTEKFANADSIHGMGQDVANIVLQSRDKIASLMGAKSNEVYFTSGGSESNNWALKGVAFANKKKGKHIIVSNVEHPSIINTCEWLAKNGFEITYLDVDTHGLVSLDKLKSAIQDDTILVSIMFANNEIGTIQPIKEICELCHNYGVLLHTDAVQATGTIEYKVKDLGVDLLSFSSHKFYGPKGIGGLYIKDGTPIDSWIHGGEQERGKRGGTTPTYLIVGMSSALEDSLTNIDSNNVKLKDLKIRLYENIKTLNVTFNGFINDLSLPGTLSVTFNNTLPGIVLNNLDLVGIEASAGSACAAASDLPSRTLLSIGLTEKEARQTVRFSIGKDNTIEDIDYTIEAIKKILSRLN